MKSLFIFFRILSFVLVFLTLSTSLKAQTYNTAYNSTVEDYANQVAEIKMRNLSPMTGYGSYAVVKGWYYNSYSNKYFIKMEAYWKCKTSSSATYYGTAEIDGVLELNSYSMDWNFGETYRNTHLRNCWTGEDTKQATNVATTAAVVYGLFKLFSDN